MADHDRRSLLRWAVHGMSALVGAILGIPAIAYLIDARNRPPRESGFRQVQGIHLTELTQDRPQQGTIYDVRRDAWTLHPNDVIGRVWVQKFGDGPDQLRVFTTICPHLGCSINRNADASTGFTCPCHNAQFTPDGERVERPGFTNPAPRTMDSLEWQRDPADPDILLVRYQNFYQGRHEKVPKA
jgi:menaquinol-cytochrome c reductase iron-sulfur subunit